MLFITFFQDETEIAAIREKIIETRKVVYRLNEQEVSRRWTFEEGVGFDLLRFLYFSSMYVF